MNPQVYWNSIGAEKEFEDPLYIEKFRPFLTQQSQILEYGCGYGRLMNMLKIQGFNNIKGFDFSPNMIKRGKTTYPHLDLNLLEKSGKIPTPNDSVDAIIMSTVLCCMIQVQEQIALIDEIHRVLKDSGILYLTDFLICDHPRYHEKYMEGLQKYGTWGIYTTTENLIVRHMSSHDIMKLLTKFDIHWFEQFDFKTMNQNPARTFHCISKKTKKSHYEL